MKITREQRDQNISLLKVLVDEKDYGEAVDKMLRDYKRKANIPGFRPGMVPMGVIRKMYGKGAVAEQSYRTASNAVFEYLQKEGIDYVGDVIPSEEQGDFDFDNNTEHEFIFEIGEAPEVNIELSEKDELTYYKIKIDEKMHAAFKDNYLRRYGRLVDVDAVRRKRFKVVVDAVNSVGGIVIPKLLRELGCEVVELNCEPTGEFAHNPEPLPENLTEIAAAVVREKADLGVVVDPDVDRLAFVSEDGSMFVEEYTLVAVADYVLSHRKGDTVSNLSSSRALRDVTERHGGKYYASAVGEVNVVAKMKEVGAVIGGEGNGGVIYPELHYGRDALVGTALFLTWLAKKGMTMTRLRATYPSYYASKNKIELTPAIDVDKVLREVKGRYAGENVNDIDGVKIDFAENWVHLRKSNTEPIIRVYTEAKSMDEADALAQRFIAEIKEICNI